MNAKYQYSKTFFSFLEYDVEAFVGNIGGYIGLFLGYALLQIPAILIALIAWCRKYVFQRQNSCMHPMEDGRRHGNKEIGVISEHCKKSNRDRKDINMKIDIIKYLIRQEVNRQLNISK